MAYSNFIAETGIIFKGVSISFSSLSKNSWNFVYIQFDEFLDKTIHHYNFAKIFHVSKKSTQNETFWVIFNHCFLVANLRSLYTLFSFFFQFSAFIKFAQKDDKRDYSKTISYPLECNLSKQKENTYRIECCIEAWNSPTWRENSSLTFVAPKLISESPWKASMSTCHCLSNTMPKRKKKNLGADSAD